jgi:pyridinium-3,5-biscarboxylic acid mononucleotide sulfurtransferase
VTDSIPITHTAAADARGLAEKRLRLEAVLKELGSIVIGFSGGVDSTLLVAEARRVLGRDGVVAVTATGDIFFPGELEDARALAARLDARHEVLETRPLDSEEFRTNPKDRCYFCKLKIFGAFKELAKARGMAAVCDGANVDDAGVYRPGMQATRELGIRSPLKEAGLTKAEVRALSRELNLPTWDRPSMPCLASRFPYGQPISKEALARVARAEGVLRDLGYRCLRVRDHGTVARIEVDPQEIEALTVRHRARIVRDLKRLGYTYVTLDLEGFRSGAMDEAIGEKPSA